MPAMKLFSAMHKIKKTVIQGSHGFINNVSIQMQRNVTEKMTEKWN